MNEMFRRFSEHASHLVGSYWAFLAACLVVVLWG